VRNVTWLGAPKPAARGPANIATAGRLSFLDREKFAASFAADVAKEKAEFMADSQVPWGVEALSGSISVPAWKNKPSWYLIATDDRMIPPPAQEFMSKRAGSTVVEVKGSHSVYVSKPEEVAALIEEAAKGVKLAKLNSSNTRRQRRQSEYAGSRSWSRSDFPSGCCWPNSAGRVCGAPLQG
jgi:pimeloyl-ACP methyl ester carboxylesterase